MGIISYDASGLPVAQWRESALTTAHRCWISIAPDGTPMFHYQSPRPGHVRRGLERYEQMHPVELGVALARGELPWR